MLQQDGGNLNGIDPLTIIDMKVANACIEAWVLDLMQSTGTEDCCANRCTHMCVVVATKIASAMYENTLEYYK